MKLHERINCILLGTLWTLAMVLILDFWLNTFYNFNIFSSAHWQFVANLQAENQPIATGFYISIAAAVLLCFSGLYMLLRPRFRKINFNPTPQPTKVEPAPEKPQPIESVTAQTMQRPPHLHIQPNHRVIPPKQPMVTQPTTTKIEPQYTQEMREIFEKGHYRVLGSKIISKVPLSLIALGTNETLWLGAYNISHEQMVDTILQFKTLFKETLEDIDIDINAFIIKPTDDTPSDAILDLASIDELSTIIEENPNAEESEADKESGNMDAFAGYIETVLTYLGNK